MKILYFNHKFKVENSEKFYLLKQLDIDKFKIKYKDYEHCIVKPRIKTHRIE